MEYREGSMAKVQQSQAPATLTGGMMSKWVYTAICFSLVLVLKASVFVEGLPILGPDLNSCKPVITPGRTAADAVDCCLVDTGRPIKDFKFDLDLPMRVRRPVHKLDDEFIRKYERAMELMRALPPQDPRSHKAQSNIHCMYSAGAYSQFNSSPELNVRHGWLFLPFHRWYLYFHERILAKLLGDDTFAIPYWAWDVQFANPPANTMPHIFLDKNSSLYDENRSKVHQPPYKADLDFFGLPGNRDPDVLLQANLYNIWQAIVGTVKNPEAFHGRPFKLGGGVILGAGNFEMGPHSAIHAWLGNNDPPFGENIAAGYPSGSDPIFFAHHSQADRLWLMWKSLGGKDLDDPDWLDAEFVFYDGNGDLVRVNVRDSLNIDNFRVEYEEVEADWLDYKPGSIREIEPKYARVGILRRLFRHFVTGESHRNVAMAVGGFFQPGINLEKNGTKISLGGVKRAVVTSRVFRPEVMKSSSCKASTSINDEVLVIAGVVRKPFDVRVRFNIFLELPEAEENTPHHFLEFLGGVIVEAEGLDVGIDPIVARRFSWTIGIGDRLQMLDIFSQKSVTITFVPAWDPKHDSDVSIVVLALNLEMQLAR